jgi:hypothetical protein
MIVTIHQPNHLPYLGFFDKMASSDVFVLYDNAQYASYDEAFQNRNKIRTAQGWIWLTVPVSAKFGTLIKDVKIADNHWHKKHWKSIEMSYSKAPYFNQYKDIFKEIYEKDWTNLADLNIALITALRDAFGIRTKLVRCSEIIPELDAKATEALVKICKSLNATKYISGKDGETYLKLEEFSKENIEVEFQHYKHPTYRQVYYGFQPYMCALDLLFNEGPKSLEILHTSRNQQ